MGRKPMITKACPKCNINIAVASKSCKCGYAFFNARKKPENSSTEISRRRTGRVKREKPQFYDAQEYDKRKKRAKKKPRQSIFEVKEEKSGQKEKETTAARAKRRRQRKEAGDGGGDLVSLLTPEKQEIAAIILAEINRKLVGMVWRS